MRIGVTTRGGTIERERAGLLLWLSGTLGAATVVIGALPDIAAKTRLPGPLWLITTAGILQSALLVALAVWAGAALAPAVGLHAPGFEAVAARRAIMPALKPQLVPGLVGGVIGGLFLFASLRLSPAVIASMQLGPFNPPLYARMLYGGITEEVLLRWGLMTLFTWLAWRFLQRRREEVTPGAITLAIAGSALLFAAGHLPAASYLIGSLSAPVVLFVIGVNATLGVLFGWLFWRWGLESAMLAHALTHLVSYVASSS